MRHTEPLLLVYYQQSEVLKLYILRKQSVCAYYYIYPAVLELLYYLRLLLCGAEP